MHIICWKKSTIPNIVYDVSGTDEISDLLFFSTLCNSVFYVVAKKTGMNIYEHISL